jgi:glutamate N-acetyltransferase/amino-acid N-acetyltransferase
MGVDPALGLRDQQIFRRVEVVRQGAIAPGYDEGKAAAVMKAATYPITIDLGQGSAEARFLACDLSHEYVSINADYRS